MIFKAFQRKLCTVASKISKTLGQNIEQNPTQQSRWTTHLSGMLVFCHTHALRLCLLLR